MANNISYAVYEDNGGGVHMIITDTDGSKHLFAGLQLYSGGRGLLQGMIDELRDDPSVWTLWDGWDADEGSEDNAIDHIIEHDALIAWSDGGEDHIDRDAMEEAGHFLLGVDYDDWRAGT